MTDPGRKKVLILTYYWPPSGGAGVQRWLKFSKYLREFNYEPVIYTAADPEYPSIDESLYRDIPENLTVLKTRVWEPYKLYKWFTFQKKGHRVNTAFLNEKKKQGPGERMAIWIRGNLFIPDARKFWIKPSIRFLSRYIHENPVDLIVSTGPPHSLHLIALRISKKSDIPWVADFRDPWTRIYYQDSLMIGKRARRKHDKLEHRVITNANAVAVVSMDMKLQFEQIGGKNIRVIPNGFDREDFENIENEEVIVKPDNKFTITHIGTLFPLRNPDVLWKVLTELVRENTRFAEDLSVNLVGAIDYSVQESIKNANLEEWVNQTGNLPYKEALTYLKNSKLLLLLVINTPASKGILTGKIFEYMIAGRPILAIGPANGEVAKVLGDTRTGHIAGFNDHSAMKKLILDFYALFTKGELNINPQNIERYSRKNLTREMAGIFDEVIKTN